MTGSIHLQASIESEYAGERRGKCWSVGVKGRKRGKVRREEGEREIDAADQKRGSVSILGWKERAM